MTAKDAALAVLREAGRPLSVADILSVIEKRNLFEFKTAGHRGVILSALKRHAEGAHHCSPAKVKVFKLEEDGRFSILRSEDSR